MMGLALVMVAAALAQAQACAYGDSDGDRDVDLDDYAEFPGCLNGPGGGLGPDREAFDFNEDDDIDLAAFQHCFETTGAGACGKAFDFVAEGSINLNGLDMFTLCLNGPDQPIACSE